LQSCGHRPRKRRRRRRRCPCSAAGASPIGRLPIRPANVSPPARGLRSGVHAPSTRARERTAVPLKWLLDAKRATQNFQGGADVPKRPHAWVVPAHTTNTCKRTFSPVRSAPPCARWRAPPCQTRSDATAGGRGRRIWPPVSRLPACPRRRWLCTIGLPAPQPSAPRACPGRSALPFSAVNADQPDPIMESKPREAGRRSESRSASPKRWMRRYTGMQRRRAHSRFRRTCCPPAPAREVWCRRLNEEAHTG
jgi:hypothetical protein